MKTSASNKTTPLHPQASTEALPNRGQDREEMNAVFLESAGGADSLVLGRIPRPHPGSTEVLVKVYATAITPTELQWFPTFHLSSGETRKFPIVLSHEFSGVVESTGLGVSRFKAGEEVYGLNDWFRNGAQAEYCLVEATGLAQKPASVDHARSAVLPISALTAWQGLFERLKLERGQRVLIHGAAGGVGTLAVQLAHWRGMQVIATTSSSNRDFVTSLGADKVIDYRSTRFEEMVHDVDGVFDTVGGETLERSWGVLARGGKLVTVATPSENTKDQRVRDAFMLVRADGAQLAEIARLVDAGKLRAFVETTFPLNQAREAYDRAKRGGMRGKITLTVVG